MKTSKLRVTGLCEGNSPVTSEFPAQRASNAENYRRARQYIQLDSKCGKIFIVATITIDVVLENC